mmetsp:Transcript_12542/g.30772  ORF Transcript_12542/g.30772 Transcript_12542/m.30772 type:complete len:856 (+) Transcript_12542:375-2942(+)|eukprot:CAMPEP_0206228488 /NCGR_PEP_ID=MMETSP0047_2-20121206/9195_1 /ASSEMBLY_ACC=CAM_ASM_000192 /TAXON_ID=195065 /ORGANISM="Chroomonas mesostigmatica_cf, Strain CCMP1168" /LENGTH=855 /DNA_ID=CAMNT_0053651733 /DNA_START=367 /DNA_END=2934 /DNA_ORIENTATION=+
MNSEQPAIIRLNPTQYAHLLDNNTNVTRVLIGPKTLARQDHEIKVLGPEEMILVPPRHYCIVKNPVKRDAQGAILLDDQNQVQLNYGEEEIRTEGAPFPLYPGELLKQIPTPLSIVPPQTALRIEAIRDHEDTGVKRVAGDEWLFMGPSTYIPRVEVKILDTIKATIVKPGTALKLRARQEMKDSKGNTRQAGEEWLMRQAGAYLPNVYEVIVDTVTPMVLTEKKAIHLRAICTFTDEYGTQRRAGEEWLLTIKDCEMHIQDVHEEVVNPALGIIALSRNHYCIIGNPWDDQGKQQMGRLVLRRGEMHFFLKPGEELVGGKILDVIVLGPDEALLLRAREPFTDIDNTARTPGDRWTVVGPCEYVPPVEVEVIKRYSAIPLDETEGIYVRNIKTGAVDTVKGRTYLLGPDEELWEKELNEDVERLLAMPQNDSKGVKLHQMTDVKPKARDKTRLVTYRTPHNSALQVYDYRHKTSRVVWGPGLVMLEPDEQFTILALSGGKPKTQNQIHSLSLSLGPDFMTDVVVVETSDHARLQIQLSYNWKFDVDRSDPEDAAKIFQVPDFVGDACKAVAARVRGAVARSTFDDFHKNSAEIIRVSVMGQDEKGKVRERFEFPNNKLVITNIDIQTVEPVDQRTRDALSLSVQQAIEITTKSQEAAARHDAERKAQEAVGLLERQKLKDEIEAEKARRALLELKAESSAVESMGHAKAEARARAEAAQIEMAAMLEHAKLQAQAQKIKSESELEQSRLQHEAEVTYRKQIDDLEIHKMKEIAAVEENKFKSQVSAIGADTIKAMAQAGPEMQAKLLAGLGLSSVLITDGSSPINLFNTAQGLLGQQQAARHVPASNMSMSGEL